MPSTPGTHFPIVADQGRQQSGRAEAAMRRGDATHAVHIRRVVEQHPAAAIDLAVDESGRQHAPAEIVTLRFAHARIGIADDRGDVRAVDQHGKARSETGVGQHAAVDQGGWHQTVSVTLRRCGGTSGLRPRRSDSAFAAR
jgi:hypothetical protein